MLIFIISAKTEKGRKKTRIGKIKMVKNFKQIFEQVKDYFTIKIRLKCFRHLNAMDAIVLRRSNQINNPQYCIKSWHHFH
jgi:hypothetical protein